MKRSDWWHIVQVLCLAQVNMWCAIGATIIALTCIFYYSLQEAQEKEDE